MSRQRILTVTVPLGDLIELYFMDHTENRIASEVPVRIPEDEWPKVCAGLGAGDHIFLVADDPGERKQLAYPAVVISLDDDNRDILVVI